MRSSHLCSASPLSKVQKKEIFTTVDVFSVLTAASSKLLSGCRMASGDPDSNVPILNLYFSDDELLGVHLSLILTKLLSWVFSYFLIRSMGGGLVVGKASTDRN